MLFVSLSLSFYVSCGKSMDIIVFVNLQWPQRKCLQRICFDIKKEYILHRVKANFSEWMCDFYCEIKKKHIFKYRVFFLINKNFRAHKKHAVVISYTPYTVWRIPSLYLNSLQLYIHILHKMINIEHFMYISYFLYKVYNNDMQHTLYNNSFIYIYSYMYTIKTVFL